MKKNVPDIRFKGFEDEWENNSTNNLFQTYCDKNHPELPVLSATQQFGMIIRDDTGLTVQHDKENEKTYKHVLPGQFVIHLRSFQGGFAHSAIEGITSPAYTICEFINKANNDDLFWKYVLSSKEFIKRLETVTYGIRDGRSINFQDFSELWFYVPNVEEQKRIATFFTTLDNLISKLEQKLEKQCNIKQALLQKMFVDLNGDNSTPNIRLKGFVGDWKEMFLGEIAKEHNVSNRNIHHQNLLSLSYGKIKRRNIKSNKGLLPASFDTYQIVRDGIIVMRFTDLQNDHKSLRIGLATEEGIVSPAYICISLKEDILPSFIYLQLHYYDAVLKQFYKMGDGLRQTLSYNDIKFLKVFVPSRKEQNKIVEFYKSLDLYISKLEQKIDKLRNIKQALLRKMFVQQ